MTNPIGEASATAALGGAFAAAEQSAFRLMARARLIAMGLFVVYTGIQFPSLLGVYWIGLVVVFGLAGWVHYRLRARCPAKEWITVAFLGLDAVMLAVAILATNPFVPDPWPIQANLRYHSFPYFFVFLALTALTYSPRLVIWTGVFVMVAWGIGSAIVFALPETKTVLDYAVPFSGPSGAEKLKFTLDPHYYSVAQPIQDVFVLLVVAAILAAAVWRSKRLVERQVETAQERANLARYFSPSMVEALAGTDQPLGGVRSQNVAVLFADIVGFTSLSEKLPPEAVIELLRDFHGRMAREVFAHDGTVDKYIGDAIMATFGTPHTGTRDASNALACAKAMLVSIDAWNQERKARGMPEAPIGVGLHFGPAVMGDIGDEQRLEYAVIGDTVNVAARLEALTREVDAPLVVSGDTVAAVRRESGSGALAGLEEQAAAQVKGRAQKVPVWILRNSDAVSSG
ncbi:MAG TPA: adenylate/guanylate cyclase domain-containing protein [Alphaproteobacteria bacterium]|nr:adenylate/guanylate cyclase domain-containing protein [Alphaproteobacteria bacterium]